MKYSSLYPTCYQNFITSKQACGNVPSTSGLYFENLQGINIKFAANAANSAYLSGMLVGADVQGWQATEPCASLDCDILLAGNPRLNHCYREALQQAGFRVSSFDITAATLAGFAFLAREQQLSDITAAPTNSRCPLG